MKWMILLFCLASPAASFGSEILYNTETRQCETETGNTKNRNPGITQCGRLTKLTGSKLSQSIDYRRRNHFSLNLRGIHIKDSNLSGVDLSGVDLEGAVLENVDLTGALLELTRLKDVQFRNVQLKDAHFFQSDLDGAVFHNSPVTLESILSARLSHRTRLPEGLVKNDELYAFATPGMILNRKGKIERVALPQAVQDQFPGLLVFLMFIDFENPPTPETLPMVEPFIIPSMEARVQPLPTELVDSDQMGLNRSDFFDVLCAARFKSCLRSREGLSSMYGLSRLPHPHLTTGLEFYHGDTQDEGIGRFVSVGSIELEPRALSEQIAIAKQSAQNRLAELYGKKMPDLVSENTPVINPLFYTESFQVRFNFLPQPQGPTQCFLKRLDDDMKLKCKVVVDFKEATPDDPQWLQQKIQHFIRSAPHSTVQVDLRLVSKLHQFVTQEIDESPTLQFMAPIRNANFWTVNSDHMYSKMRW